MHAHVAAEQHRNHSQHSSAIPHQGTAPLLFCAELKPSYLGVCFICWHNSLTDIYIPNLQWEMMRHALVHTSLDMHPDTQQWWLAAKIYSTDIQQVYVKALVCFSCLYIHNSVSYNRERETERKRERERQREREREKQREREIQRERERERERERDREREREKQKDRATERRKQKNTKNMKSHLHPLIKLYRNKIQTISKTMSLHIFSTYSLLDQYNQSKQGFTYWAYIKIHQY